MFTCKRLTPCSPVGRDKADTTVSKIRTPLHAPQHSCQLTLLPHTNLLVGQHRPRSLPTVCSTSGGERQQQQQAAVGQAAVWWCGYNRAWYKRAKLGAVCCGTAVLSECVSSSSIVFVVCSSWYMRSQVVHLALSMSKAVCQARFEQTEYILHAVYEPAAHGLVPLRPARRVPSLAAASFYHRCR